MDHTRCVACDHVVETCDLGTEYTNQRADVGLQEPCSAGHDGMLPFECRNPPKTEERMSNKSRSSKMSLRVHRHLPISVEVCPGIRL